MNIKKINRLGIAVKDLDKAIDFFVNVLGAKRGVLYQGFLDTLVTLTAFLLSVASILQWSVTLPLSVMLLIELAIKDLLLMLSRLRVQHLLQSGNLLSTGQRSTRRRNG